MYLLNQCCCDLCDMPEDATFREGMLPSELETKKVALAPEVCRQFLLRKQYILSQIHLHSSVTVYVRMAMRSMLFIVQDVSHDGIPQHLHQMAASPFHSQFGGDSPPPNGDALNAFYRNGGCLWVFLHWRMIQDLSQGEMNFVL